MLTLTTSAVEALDLILHSGPDIPDEAGLRIGMADGSQLNVQLVPEPAPGDQIIEDGGARVFVDPGAADLLDNAELDARHEGDQIAFGVLPAGTADARMNGDGSS
jgi:iron-sulfur cluster assembly protein